MPTPALDLLRFQFDLAWSLFEYHLERLQPEDFLWEPVELCWSLRPADDGSWVPDWSDAEPDPVPVPTIGWLTWHLGWWWSVALDHAEGRAPRDRSEVAWPGPGAAVSWLRELCTLWRGALQSLTEEDLARTAAFPWGDDAGYSVSHMVAWVNAELMKNVAEIGQLWLLRAAGGCPPEGGNGGEEA